MNNEKTTHDQLVIRAMKWLRKPSSGKNICYRGACGVVVPELNSFAQEQPDVIGWLNGGVSHMIECKTTRSDFLAESRKAHRKNSSGTYRWYLSPPNIITEQDVPEHWGLLHCYPKKITVVVDAPINPDRNVYAELAMMYSLLRRVEIRGNLRECFAPKWNGI